MQKRKFNRKKRKIYKLIYCSLFDKCEIGINFNSK